MPFRDHPEIEPLPIILNLKDDLMWFFDQVYFNQVCLGVIDGIIQGFLGDDDKWLR